MDHFNNNSTILIQNLSFAIIQLMLHIDIGVSTVSRRDVLLKQKWIDCIGGCFMELELSQDADTKSTGWVCLVFSFRISKQTGCKSNWDDWRQQRPSLLNQYDSLGDEMAQIKFNLL